MSCWDSWLTTTTTTSAELSTELYRKLQVSSVGNEDDERLSNPPELL